ncbi:MAG: hypothetical protein WC356_05595 [Candidatus Micrarchaeia archaeon]|jgi:hypothetical protein
MTLARQPHSQRCEKIADRNDIIAFMKFAGFDVELAERTDGVQELTITGFDDTGDTYMLEFASITPTGENHCDKCDHWDMCEGCPYTDERAIHTSAPAPENDLLKQIRKFHAAAHKEMCKDDADELHTTFWKGQWLAYNNVAGLVEHMEDSYTSAPAPEDQLPEESEQWREAYQNGYTDGQAKAAIENERINAQVAKAAREQAETTDNILAVLKKRYRKEMAIIDYIEMIECEVESLRAQQEPQQ